MGKHRLGNAKLLNTKAYICQRRTNKNEEGETNMDQRRITSVRCIFKTFDA